MKEKDNVFISVAKLKSRFPPTFSWIYRKDLFKIIDDLAEKERSTIFENAEIEVRKEAMERWANLTKGFDRPIVDKQN